MAFEGERGLCDIERISHTEDSRILSIYYKDILILVVISHCILGQWPYIAHNSEILAVW